MNTQVNKRRVAIICPPFYGHARPLWYLAESMEKDGDVKCLFFDFFGKSFPFSGTVEIEKIYNTFNDDLLALTKHGTEMQSKELLVSLASFYKEMYRPVMESIQRFRPDIIIVDHYFGIGLFIARELNIPFIVAFSSPDLFIMNRENDDKTAKMNELIEEKRNKLYMEVMKDITGFAISSYVSSPWLNICFAPPAILPADAEICRDWHFTFPDGNRRPLIFIGAVNPPPVPLADDDTFKASLVKDGRKKILVSFGTVWLRQLGSQERNKNFISLYKNLLLAFNSDSYHIVYSGDVELFKTAMADMTIEATVTLTAFINQPYLVDVFDLVIFHGGYNTFCECVAQGVPMLVFPIGFDQGRIGDLVTENGLGSRLPFKYNSASVIMETASALLDQCRRSDVRAERIRHSFNKPFDTRRMVRLINEIIAPGRSVNGERMNTVY